MTRHHIGLFFFSIRPEWTLNCLKYVVFIWYKPCVLRVTDCWPNVHTSQRQSAFYFAWARDMPQWCSPKWTHSIRGGRPTSALGKQVETVIRYLHAAADPDYSKPRKRWESRATGEYMFLVWYRRSNGVDSGSFLMYIRPWVWIPCDHISKPQFHQNSNLNTEVILCDIALGHG